MIYTLIRNSMRFAFKQNKAEMGAPVRSLAKSGWFIRQWLANFTHSRRMGTWMSLNLEVRAEECVRGCEEKPNHHDVGHRIGIQVQWCETRRSEEIEVKDYAPTFPGNTAREACSEPPAQSPSPRTSWPKASPLVGAHHCHCSG